MRRIAEYEIEDHGVENSQYFQGCGVSFTNWEDVAVGIGNTPNEAYDDALESLAQNDWNVEAMPQNPLSDKSGIERGYVLERDGEILARGTQDDLAKWIHRHTSHSVHQALTHQGYSIEEDPDEDMSDELHHFVCVYVSAAGKQRKGRGVSGASMPGRDDVDEDAVTELQLYADNDATLYRNSYTPVVRNMIKMKMRGVYDHKRAIDGFMYHAERAAKAYAREFGGNWHTIFNRPTRYEAAREWTEQFEQQYRDGELEHFVPDSMKARYLEEAG